MNRNLLRLMSATHAFWYQLTGGLVGGSAFGTSFLLLTTSGRKSGQRRTTPLLYLQDAESFVIVASNGGSDRHPGWCLNLRANPVAEVQIGRTKRAVRAEEADENERQRLWPLLVTMYSRYEQYQQGTERKIPVVLLRPES